MGHSQRTSSVLGVRSTLVSVRPVVGFDLQPSVDDLKKSLMLAAVLQPFEPGRVVPAELAFGIADLG